MAPGLERGYRSGCVELVGRADTYRIELFLFEHLAVIFVSLADPVSLGHLPRPLDVDVGARDELDFVFDCLVTRNMRSLCNASDTDDPDPKSLGQVQIPPTCVRPLFDFLVKSSLDSLRTSLV